MDQDYVNGLAVSPTIDGKVVCFAARRSGLYCSDDGGHNWRNILTDSNRGRPVAATYVAVSSEFEVDPCIFVGTENGVLKSEDGGQSWKLVPLPSLTSLITAIALSPHFQYDGFVIVSTMEDGVFRSTDRGESWGAWNINLLDRGVLCLALSPAFSQDKTIFIGTETGVFYSSNGGRSWREAIFPSGRNSLKFIPVLSLAISPGYPHDGILFAGTESEGLWVSKDKGKSWRRLGKKAIEGSVNCIVLSPLYPAQPDILVVHNTSLLISRDNGTSWSQWPGKSIEQTSISSALAFNGLEPGSPLLVGLTNGNVIRV